MLDGAGTGCGLWVGLIVGVSSGSNDGYDFERGRSVSISYDS